MTKVKSNGFKIAVGERVYNLFCESSKLRDEWLQIITKVQSEWRAKQAVSRKESIVQPVEVNEVKLQGDKTKKLNKRESSKKLLEKAFAVSSEQNDVDAEQLQKILQPCNGCDGTC